MKRPVYVKIKKSISSLVMLAALLSLTLLLVHDEDFRASIGGVIQTLLWILIPVFAVIVLTRWWQEFRPPIIYPFRNSTGDKDAHEHFDAVARNITVLLQLELYRISELLYIPQSGAVHHLAYEKNSVPRPSAPYKADFAQTQMRMETEVMENLKGIGALSLGRINLPLGGIVSVFARILGGPGVTGSLQKYGSRLIIIAGYERRKWEVNSDTLPATLQSEENVARELASCLAYKMLADLQGQTHWLAFREIVGGLEQYRRFIRSGRQNMHALQDAQRCFEQATVIDAQSAPAWYNLGLAYDAQGNYSAALESFKLAIQLEASLVEAYFGIGQIYARNHELKQAIEMGERAITLAEKTHKAVPAIRTSLGKWLIQAPKFSRSEAERECKEAIKQLKTADRIYRRFAVGARFNTDASHEERRNLRDSREQTLIELTQAYLLLDQLYSDQLVFSVEQAPVEHKAWSNTIKKTVLRWSWSPRKKMERILRKRLRLNPNSGITHAELGGLYARQGSYEKAARQMKQAGQISPEDTAVSFTISEFFLDQAVADVFDLIKESQEHAETWRHEWDADRVTAIKEQLSWASDYYMDQLSQASKYYATVIEDITYALRGLATVNGSLSILMALCDEDETYHSQIGLAKGLLGKALALSPIDIETLTGLAGIYAIDSGLRYRLQGTEETVPDEIDTDTVALEYTYDDIADAVKNGSIRNWDKSTLDQLNASPQNQVYLWFFGWLYIQNGSPVDGIEYLERALPMGEFTEAALVAYDLGRVYQSLERWDDAIRCYNRVELDDPYYWLSQIELADVLLEQHKMDVRHASRSSSILARDWDAAVRADRQTAKETAETVSDPNAGPSDVRLSDTVPADAQSQLDVERPIDADRAYENALYAAQDDPTLRAVTLASLAELHRIKGDYEKSIPRCLEAMNLSPGYLYPYIVMAFVYEDLCDYDRQIEYLERVEELTPYQDLGNYHMWLGDAFFKKATATSEKQASESWFDKAIKQYRQALQLFEQENTEDQSRAYVALGTALTELMQYKEAEVVYRAALELQKESTNIHETLLQLGQVLFKLEKFSEAQESYERAIKSLEVRIKRSEHDGNEEELASYKLGLAWACNDLAYYLYAERSIELEKGLALANRALDTLAEVKIDEKKKLIDQGYYLDTRGWIQYHLGQYDEACRDLERAIELSKGSMNDHAHLALAYEKQAESGQTESQQKQCKERARVQWKRALELDHDGVWKQAAAEHGQASQCSV